MSDRLNVVLSLLIIFLRFCVCVSTQDKRTTSSRCSQCKVSCWITLKLHLIKIDMCVLSDGHSSLSLNCNFVFCMLWFVPFLLISCNPRCYDDTKAWITLWNQWTIDSKICVFIVAFLIFFMYCCMLDIMLYATPTFDVLSELNSKC